MKSTHFIAILFFFSFGFINPVHSQEEQSREERELENQLFDDALIEQVEDSEEPDKVLHAEPLYIDLIRDLGARKGEQEWNLGFGVLDRDGYTEIEALIEYEFAVIDRLGLEVELPFSFFSVDESGVVRPENKLNSLQVAAQYTLVVSKPAKFSFAMGYLHEFELTSFERYGKENLYRGNVFNPFTVIAKRWGDNFHTLIYAGPVIERLFNAGTAQTDWQINTNLDYMISGTTNFVGVEFNKSFEDGDFDMTIRPQMRVSIDGHWMCGIVTGIPVEQENEGLSMFLRLIYEPD